MLCRRLDRMVVAMSYQYLFCATCGQKRSGHSYTCSVCGSALRRPENEHRSVTVVHLEPLQRDSQRVREPVAA
jgi:hypothetical protein